MGERAYWRHVKTREIWAVETNDEHPVACCGPLAAGDVSRVLLPYLPMSVRDIIDLRDASLADFERVFGSDANPGGEIAGRIDKKDPGDVFIYVGNPMPVFAAVFRVLARGGLFAFTVQTHEGEGAVLGEDGRYAQAESYVREEAERPFDLAAGPVFRATLMRIGDGEHVLVIALHHIASDGWSREILLREVG